LKGGSLPAGRLEPRIRRPAFFVSVGTYDSDGDGLIDGWEDLIGTKPVLPDSDCDGVSDGAASRVPWAQPARPRNVCHLY